MRRAFTLIELLIVVSIIAILAAIALPNMLEAQTRAKVSRAKADIRSIVLAVESYRVENNVLPLVGDDHGRSIIPYPPADFGPENDESKLAPILTTPVAYMTSLLVDPFYATRADVDELLEGRGFHYATRQYARANDGEEGEESFLIYGRMMGGDHVTLRYFISSHGPDKDHDDDEDMEDIDAAVSYDPTNGSVSNGDIAYFGPGGVLN